MCLVDYELIQQEKKKGNAITVQPIQSNTFSEVIVYSILLSITIWGLFQIHSNFQLEDWSFEFQEVFEDITTVLSSNDHPGSQFLVGHSISETAFYLCFRHHSFRYSEPTIYIILLQHDSTSNFDYCRWLFLTWSHSWDTLIFCCYISIKPNFFVR